MLAFMVILQDVVDLKREQWAVSRGGTGQSADDVGTASDWLQSADCGNIV